MARVYFKLRNNNAIKYRNNKVPRIKIKVVAIKNGIWLIIEDNGVGIPAGEIGRVFEKGFTVNNGRINSKSIVRGMYLFYKLYYKLKLLIDI